MSKPAKPDLEVMLGGGDRRMTGRSNAVAQIAARDPATRVELLRVLESPDAILRMRAADALEKVSCIDPELLNAFRRRFVEMAPLEEQQEVRWHLAQILPRLALDSEQRDRAVAAMREYLKDRSSIVQAWSLNAIAEFAHQDARYSGLARELADEALRSERPAVRSRARAILLKQDRSEKARHA